MAAARILVLEDDDNLRDVLAEVLTDEGFEVKAVGRGEAAVECAAQQSFCRQFHQSHEVDRAARWATLIWGSRALPGVLPSALSSPQRELPELREILSALAASPQGEELPTAVQAVAMALSRMSAPSLLAVARSLPKGWTAATEAT